MRLTAAPAALLLAGLSGCADVVRPSPPGDAAAPEDAAEDAPEVALPPGLARGLTITSVALYQAVRVPLLDAERVVAPRETPVVAGRRAMVRVSVRPAAGDEPATLDAELTVRSGAGTAVLRDRKRIARASREHRSDETFVFSLTDAQVTPDARVSVRVLAPGGAPEVAGVEDRARFPYEGGDHALRAFDGGPLEVTLVPFQWNFDRSGRLPYTTALVLNDLRDALRAAYPVREVRVEVRAPVPWERGLLPSGDADFGALLSALRALRASDGAPATRYYYGMVAPADTIGDYCRGRCVYGQAYLPQSPADPRGRVAAGVGFGGLEDVRAFVHELGHAHGRMHAPCGDAAGVDPEYPYENAAIGVWGWDERQRQMVSPERPDFMAYCRSEWVSDYTYRALWAWITEVNGVAAPRGLGAPRAARARPHRVLRERAGALEWLDALDEPEATGAAALRWVDAAGAVVASGRARVDALADGEERHVLVPEAPAGARWLDLTLDGRTRRVALPTR